MNQTIAVGNRLGRVFINACYEGGSMIVDIPDVNALVHDLLKAAGMELRVCCQPIDTPHYSTDGPHGGKGAKSQS